MIMYVFVFFKLHFFLIFIYLFIYLFVPLVCVSYPQTLSEYADIEKKVHWDSVKVKVKYTGSLSDNFSFNPVPITTGQAEAAWNWSLPDTFINDSMNQALDLFSWSPHVYPLSHILSPCKHSITNRRNNCTRWKVPYLVIAQLWYYMDDCSQLLCEMPRHTADAGMFSYQNNHYLCQRDYIFAGVSLSVSNITQNVVIDRFSWNFRIAW